VKITETTTGRITKYERKRTRNRSKEHRARKRKQEKEGKNCIRKIQRTTGRAKNIKKIKTRHREQGMGNNEQKEFHREQAAKNKNRENNKQRTKTVNNE
jgi:hypothetical protein